ncbi:hypothetical protein CVS40_8594 [Lucilia cuprina]|nr:hypothetical protein CVS40_8594 [Lucilia cuprina]
MVNEDETYGIIGDCFHIRNTTICEANKLRKLPEDGCDARLLKGGNADCHFITNMEEIVELLNDNTIFVTNFNGTIKNEKEERTINGTFMIQLKNESLKIGNQTFSSKDATTIQTLPSIFTNVTNKGLKLSLEYIHTSNLKNIEHIKKLGEAFNISTIIEAIVLIILA